MVLQTQVNTLLFSFFFGMIFSFLLTIHYRFIYHDKKSYQIISTFLIVIGSTIFYFIGIRKINYGIFHPYSAIMILLGFIIEHSLHKYLNKKIAFKKKK